MFRLSKKIKIIGLVIMSLLVLGVKIVLTPPPIFIHGLSNFICPEARYYFGTKKPLIALTIDDSPDNNIFPNGTLEILDVLAQYQVKATFFIITNKAQAFPELITSIVEQGHELGNHLTNDESSINLGEKFEAEFTKADSFLRSFAAVNWFRPGHGWCNNSMATTVDKYNYKTALGSVWSYDTIISSPKFSSWYIKHNVRPGAIIVLHDSDGQNNQRAKNTIATLKQIIPQLQKRGYEFVTLSELEARA